MSMAAILSPDAVPGGLLSAGRWRIGAARAIAVAHRPDRRGGRERRRLGRRRTILYGAAPMTPARIAEALDTFGPVLMQGYGQTECLGMCTSLRKDEHDPVRRPGLLASCGRPVAGVRAEILGEDGTPVPHGEVGEVCVR